MKLHNHQSQFNDILIPQNQTTTSNVARGIRELLC
jgi:hypothetical protein